MNMNYSYIKSEADAQHSGLWVHMATRRGHEILQANGYDYRKNHPITYPHHVCEAYFNADQNDLNGQQSLF